MDDTFTIHTYGFDTIHFLLNDCVPVFFDKLFNLKIINLLHYSNNVIGNIDIYIDGVTHKFIELPVSVTIPVDFNLSYGKTYISIYLHAGLMKIKDIKFQIIPIID
jgi:hypothetical protein